MQAIFYYLCWEKAQDPYLKQGVSGNRRPKGALNGGNGSFMVAGKSAKLHLFVKDNDGNIYRSNVYGKVMKQTGCRKMSEKLYQNILKKFEKASFTVDDFGNIEWDCSLL